MSDLTRSARSWSPAVLGGYPRSRTELLQLASPTYRCRVRIDHGGTKAAERTLSRILWKSSTLRVGIRHASHSRYHFFSRTGFPRRDKYCNDLTSLRGSRSPSSAMLLFVSTSVVRLGTDRCKDWEMDDIRLFASRRVRRRRRRGMFPKTVIELSVKSIQSCWSCAHDQETPVNIHPDSDAWRNGGAHLGYTKIFNGRDGVSCEPNF